MRPLFLHNLFIGILFLVTLVGSSLLERRVRASSAQQGRSKPEWSLAVIAVGLLVCATVSVVAAVTHPAPLPGGVWWPTIAGIALLWTGIALRIWSVATLGHFFQLTVVVQDDHRVIDTGPYRFVRHPAYLAILVNCIGAGLVASDWIALGVLFLGVAGALLLRIRVEEQELLQALGEEYATYMRNTASLLPGLY